jgi:hypothetical protein
VLDAEDYLLRSDGKISLLLAKSFTLAVTVTYNKVSLTARENFLCNFGLGYQRTF